MQWPENTVNTKKLDSLKHSQHASQPAGLPRCASASVDAGAHVPGPADPAELRRGAVPHAEPLAPRAVGGALPGRGGWFGGCLNELTVDLSYSDGYFFVRD